MRVQSAKRQYEDRLTVGRHLEKRRVSQANNSLEEEVMTSRGQGTLRR